jgi:hypothetical protein
LHQWASDLFRTATQKNSSFGKEIQDNKWICSTTRLSTHVQLSQYLEVLESSQIQGCKDLERTSRAEMQALLLACPPWKAPHRSDVSYKGTSPTPFASTFQKRRATFAKIVLLLRQSRTACNLRTMDLQDPLLAPSLPSQIGGTTSSREKQNMRSKT